MSNPYETLGVDEGASEEEIKRAYRKKAMEHHPDRGGDATAMVALNAAYEELTKQPPSIDDSATLSLARAFDEMLADDAPAGDAVRIIERAVVKAISRYEFEVKKLESYLVKLDKRAGRVVASEGVDNLWAKAVAERHKRYQLGLARAQREVAVAKRVLEMLAQYQGSGEPEPGFTAWDQRF